MYIFKKIEKCKCNLPKQVYVNDLLVRYFSPLFSFFTLAHAHILAHLLTFSNYTNIDDIKLFIIKIRKKYNEFL